MLTLQAERRPAQWDKRLLAKLAANVVTAFLAVAGAVLSTIIGSMVPGAVLVLAPDHPTLSVMARLLTIPTVMASAVLVGWLLARSRPIGSLPAIAAGLACYVLSQLLPLTDGLDLASALRNAAAQSLVSLCFVMPSARRSGVTLTKAAGLCCCAAICSLAAVVAWSALNHVRPSGTDVLSSNTVESPPSMRGGCGGQLNVPSAKLHGRRIGWVFWRGCAGNAPSGPMRVTSRDFCNAATARAGGSQRNTSPGRSNAPG